MLLQDQEDLRIMLGIQDEAAPLPVDVMLEYEEMLRLWHRRGAGPLGPLGCALVLRLAGQTAPARAPVETPRDSLAWRSIATGTRIVATIVSDEPGQKPIERTGRFVRLFHQGLLEVALDGDSATTEVPHRYVRLDSGEAVKKVEDESKKQKQGGKQPA